MIRNPESIMPEWKKEIRDRLADSKLEPAREAEIVEELSQHLEDRYAESLARGATPEEAYRAALAELCDRESIQRELRQVESQVSQDPVVLGANRRINMLGGFGRIYAMARGCSRKRPASLCWRLSRSAWASARTRLFSAASTRCFSDHAGDEGAGAPVLRQT